MDAPEDKTMVGNKDISNSNQAEDMCLLACVPPPSTLNANHTQADESDMLTTTDHFQHICIIPIIFIISTNIFSSLLPLPPFVAFFVERS